MAEIDLEQHFASLSKRQTMMVLAAMTFGGSDAESAFAYLPEEEAELLMSRAKSIRELAQTSRIPLVVVEMKRLMTVRRRQLSTVEPMFFAEVLKKQRPALAEVVLRALPIDLADRVRRMLRAPKAPLRRDIPLDVLSMIRAGLETMLRKVVPRTGTFRFADVYELLAREMMALVDRMGVKALGTAFAGLSTDDRQELMAALPVEQRSLAQRAAEAAAPRRLNPDDAVSLLAMYAPADNPSAAIRNAGAQRVMRAALAGSEGEGQRLAERFPGELGGYFRAWFSEERSKAVKGDGGRADVLEQVERLGQKGIIDRPLRVSMPVSRQAGAHSEVSPPRPRAHSLSDVSSQVVRSAEGRSRDEKRMEVPLLNPPPARASAPESSARRHEGSSTLPPRGRGRGGGAR